MRTHFTVSVIHTYIYSHWCGCICFPRANGTFESFQWHSG